MDISSRSKASSAMGKEPGIKSFMSNLSSRLSNLGDELHAGKQHSTTLKGLMKSMEYKSTETCSSMTSGILEMLSQLEKDFKVLAREENSDSSSLKQQLASLNQEKMKVEQNVLLLDSRVSEVEKEIGVELSLPLIE